MNSKHTPSPWRMIENDRTFVISAEDNELAHVGKTARVTTIGEHKASKANACLIAAAPELLEALKAILRHDATKIDIIQWAYDIDRAVMAIAKAEGRE